MGPIIALLVGVIFSTFSFSAVLNPNRVIKPFSRNAQNLLPKKNFIKGPYSSPLHVYVETTSVLNVAPWLQLHHVVFIGEHNSDKVYAIDYSPINQTENVGRLLMGENCEGEIRVRILRADDIYDKSDVKKKWSCFSTLSADRCDISRTVLTVEDVLLSDDELLHAQRFIRRIIKKWSLPMNLYTHNCQHFSWFVKDLLQYEDVYLVE